MSIWDAAHAVAQTRALASDLLDEAIRSAWNRNALRAAQALADVLASYARWPIQADGIGRLVAEFAWTSAAALLWRGLYLRRQIERC